MKSFGRASRRDTRYVITLRSGEIVRVDACKVVPIPTDNGVLVYFHSNNYNMQPIVFKADDIITMENDGKVVDIWAFIIGCLGGGAMGAVVYRICKDTICCTIKNTFLNKAFTIVIISGVVYITATAIGDILGDKSTDFINDCKYVGRTGYNWIKEKFSKKIDDSEIKE